MARAVLLAALLVAAAGLSAATINEQGLPENIQIVRPLGMVLNEEAIEAARQYRFKPAMKDGHPVSKRINIEINFRLY